MPDSVKAVGPWAFAYGDRLTTATIGSGLSQISDNMFNSCTNLTSVVFGSGVTSAGDNVFTNCPKLASVLFLGAAPTLSGVNKVVFGSNQTATVYYVPGAQGWGASWAGRPTAAFVLKSTGVSYSPGTVAFSWSATGAVPVSVERRASLQAGGWIRLGSGLTNGVFVDQAPPAGAGFYRAVCP